jgi:prepilin-type processing-associated H-X9-DG protein
MLVVIATIALLFSLLLPALSSARDQMKMLKCSSNLRSVAFEFQLFAEDQNPEGQGDSGRGSRRGFFINDFQDLLYRIDEFWEVPGSTTGVLEAKNEIMLCPAGPARLIKRRGFPCGNAAIGPAEDVTLAMNMRLYRAEVEFHGKLVLAPAAATHLHADVLSHPYVPLLLDVDGERAAARGLEPFYTAPPVEGDNDPYSDGRYWMPSKRHRGRTNVAFVGGHVLSSTRPERETWDWRYQGDVGN